MAFYHRDFRRSETRPIARSRTRSPRDVSASRGARTPRIRHVTGQRRVAFAANTDARPGRLSRKFVIRRAIPVSTSAVTLGAAVLQTASQPRNTDDASSPSRRGRCVTSGRPAGASRTAAFELALPRALGRHSTPRISVSTCRPGRRQGPCRARTTFVDGSRHPPRQAPLPMRGCGRASTALEQAWRGLVSIGSRRPSRAGGRRRPSARRQQPDAAKLTSYDRRSRALPRQQLPEMCLAPVLRSRERKSPERRGCRASDASTRPVDRCRPSDEAIASQTDRSSRGDLRP